MEPTDTEFMSRALELARRADARVEPNPRVGAVVVRDGRIVGEGFHAEAGRPHAEVLAIEAAGDAAKGATLYVTLEPCRHIGKTPPCSEAVLRAGIVRVVAARPDPNPAAEGGAAVLRARGVQVDFGVLEAEADALVAPFLKAHRTGLPHVTLKWAMSLDGRIATRTRDSRWLTGEGTRERARRQRAQFGAILVGVGTALADDPLLTAAEPTDFTPLRVVLDSTARIPLGSRLVLTAREFPLLVAVAASAPADRQHALEEAGATVWAAPAGPDGRPEPTSVLRHLVGRGVHSILVEGGASVSGAFLDSRLVDEAHVYLAPVILGGREALSAIDGAGAATVADALRARIVSVERNDEDVFLRAIL